MFKSFTAVLALLCVSSVSGFAPQIHHVVTNAKTSSSSTSLNLFNEESAKKATASFVAATLLLGNIATVAPAVAAMDDSYDFAGGSSSQVIAARSGGRAGGRSAGARAAPRSSAPRPSSTTTNTRVIERRTYVTPSPVYSSPGIIIAPPIYNPYPGLGLGLGLNAVNQIGNDMRDYRQENEIRDARYQLEQSRSREAEMEARLRQLEMQQNSNQFTQQQQQQLLMQQQMMQQQAAPAK